MNRAVHPPTTASEIQLIWKSKCNADETFTLLQQTQTKRFL
jgi:hypothetical protein